MRRLISLLLCLFIAPALAQTSPAPAPTPAAPPLPRVEIVTTAGRFVLELETVKAPITAGNFLRYVDQRKLDGTAFYRVTKSGERFGFVQFGVDNDPKKSLPPIKHEPTSQTGLLHLDGVISSARAGPGTARGEFIIGLGEMPGLDADPKRPDDAEKTNLGYATFGRVVEGLDVIEKIFAAPNSPTATLRGYFKGELPLTPVKILTARRLK